MDFKAGDKIYKIKNGILDKSKVYEIENIKIEKGGNWHDGYFTNWIASLMGERELFIIVFIVWGEKTEIYAARAENLESS
jgi:hypothetical protein